MAMMFASVKPTLEKAQATTDASDRIARETAQSFIRVTMFTFIREPLGR